MKVMLRRLTVLALLAAAIPTCAQDIGRVLLAAGDAVAIRGNQTIKLTLGSGVREKDVLRTGPASNLQVRFIDESITSLRENSELSVDEFRFSGREDGSERAFFRLVKGGLRTITGLVGRANHPNYSLGSITSTIGIRGTHFIVRLCQDDCPITERTAGADGVMAPAGAPGDNAPNGMYGVNLGAGGVGPNQMVVKTNADEKTLGINEPWYVASINDPVQRMVAPFNLLSYQLQKGKSTTKAAGTGNEQTAAGGASQDSRAAPEPPPPPPPLTFVATEQRGTTGDLAVLPTANGWVVAYLFGSNNHDVEFADKRPGTFNSSNQLTGYGTAGTPISGALGSGTITDTGNIFFAGGTVFTYGRWTGPFTVTASDGSTYSSLASGVLFGTANVINGESNFPGSGQATYSYRGGPRAYDFAGNPGNVNGGTALIDFLARTMSITGFSVNFPSVGTFGPANFSLSGSGSGGMTSGRGEFTGSLSGSCSGGGCASGSAFGVFDAGLAGSTTGFDAMVVAGGFNGTKAGEAVFLAGYEKTSFTAGGSTPVPQALAIAFVHPSPNVANLANLSQFSQNMTFSGGPGGVLTSFGDGVNFPSGMLNSGSVVDVGTTTTIDGGTMYWGRWLGPGTTVIGANPGNVTINNPGSGVPYVYGDHTNQMPTSGAAIYSFAGGPKPVNLNGVAGSFSGTGALNVDFVTRNVTVSTPIGLSVAGDTFTIQSCTGCGYTSATQPHLSGSIGGQCTGTSSCLTPTPFSGSITGHFTGPQGAGLATSGVITSSPAPNVAFGAAFKR